MTFVSQTKLQELEQRYAEQQQKHDAISSEMDVLRHEAERARQRPLTDSAHVQTDLDALLFKNSTAALLIGV